VHVAGVASDPEEIAAYAEAGATRVILSWGLAYPDQAECTLEALRRSVEVAVGGR
jgi:hypothetical protein